MPGAVGSATAGAVTLLPFVILALLNQASVASCADDNRGVRSRKNSGSKIRRFNSFPPGIQHGVFVDMNVRISNTKLSIMWLYSR